MMSAVLRFVSCLMVVLLWVLPANAADPPPPSAPAPAPAPAPKKPARRVAIVVGANEPAPGRQALKYSHADAQLLADTLVRVGHFAKPDVRVLLEPKPAEVLGALDAASRELAAAGAGDSLLLFYYSGHSDGQHVFPHGEKLALTDLRARLGSSSARVRIAIVDTCRGGSWTRAKGLTVGPPLDEIDLMNVSTEGTALLSSSSGMESAHEAGSIKGSFFTHHLNAGLLGAADTSGDGNVTLQEAFVYARERTVRDSARMAATTQHPSFDMQLRGRQDIVLAQTKSTKSALRVVQKNALEIIHLGSGATVAETPPGALDLRLALAPGRYVVRRVDGARVFSKEIAITADNTVTLDESQLENANDKLALKLTRADDDPPQPPQPQPQPPQSQPQPTESAKQPDTQPSQQQQQQQQPCVPCCAEQCKPRCVSAHSECECRKYHFRIEHLFEEKKCPDEEKKEKEDKWEKTNVIGVRGSITRTNGAETDGTFGAAMAQVATEQYKSEGLLSAHGLMNLSLGGGSGGLEGSLGGTVTAGIRAPIGEHHGPTFRIGPGGELLGNSRFYFSRLALPVIEVGYQYLRDRTVLEVGARGAAIITGRYNSGHRTRRELGDGSIEWGGYLSAHHKIGRLDVSVTRIEARDEYPGGAVTVGRGWLCGHLLDKLAICADAMLIDGGASYYAPPHIPGNVFSIYGGLTVGALQF